MGFIGSLALLAVALASSTFFAAIRASKAELEGGFFNSAGIDILEEYTKISNEHILTLKRRKLTLGATSLGVHILDDLFMLFEINTRSGLSFLLGGLLMKYLPTKMEVMIDLPLLHGIKLSKFFKSWRFG